MHLDDFSQVFEAENRSHARIQIRATLIAPRASQRLLGLWGARTAPRDVVSG